MKVALVYDRVNKWGGAERVLLALNEIFPQAPLYTAVYQSEKAPWAKAFPKIYTSFLQKFSYLRDKHELLGIFMPIIFESFNFDDYDLVISLTSEAAKGIITKPKTLHVCYCLTPTRYLWSHYDTYFKGGSFKAMATPAVEYLRKWDKIAVARPDVLVAISSEVKKRVKKFYGCSSEIIFPPVDLRSFRGEANSSSILSSIEVKRGEYYLLVGRLVPYKRVDLVIEAFNKLGDRLVIVGTGSEEHQLRNMAKGNISFTGFLPEADVFSFYEGAKALIFAQEEDFGMVAVEAQAAGVPVIAYRKGGALDTVIEGETGVFFQEQTVHSLIDAINKFKRMRFEGEKIKLNAARFSQEKFKSKFKNLIKELLVKDQA